MDTVSAVAVLDFLEKRIIVKIFHSELLTHIFHSLVVNLYSAEKLVFGNLTVNRENRGNYYTGFRQGLSELFDILTVHTDISVQRLIRISQAVQSVMKYDY